MIELNSILITNKTARKIIKNIFEHPNGVYSIYFHDDRDVIYVSSKIELYTYINNLKA